MSDSTEPVNALIDRVFGLIDTASRLPSVATNSAKRERLSQLHDEATRVFDAVLPTAGSPAGLRVIATCASKIVTDLQAITQVG